MMVEAAPAKKFAVFVCLIKVWGKACGMQIFTVTKM